MGKRTSHTRVLTNRQGIVMIDNIFEDIHLYYLSQRYQDIVSTVSELEKIVMTEGLETKPLPILSKGLEKVQLLALKISLNLWLPGLMQRRDSTGSLVRDADLGIGNHYVEKKLLFWTDTFRVWGAVVIDWEYHLASFARDVGIDKKSDQYPYFCVSVEPEIFRLVRAKIILLAAKVWSREAHV